MTVEQHIQEYSSLPEELKKQVDDYIASLKGKFIGKKQPKEGPYAVKLGLAEGMIKILPGFDDPIEGFEEYM